MKGGKKAKHVAMTYGSILINPLISARIIVTFTHDISE